MLFLVLQKAPRLSCHEAPLSLCRRSSSVNILSSWYYGSDLRPQIALTGLFSTASNISLSPWFQGDHACVANSRWGLTYCSVYISQVGPLFRGSGRPWLSCPGRSARFWPFWQTVRLASACLFWLPPRSLSFPIVSSCLPFMFPPTLPCYQVQVWPAALFSQPHMVPS